MRLFALMGLLMGLTGCTGYNMLHPQLEQKPAHYVATRAATCVAGWVHESYGGSMALPKPAWEIYHYDWEGVERGSIIVFQAGKYTPVHRVTGGNHESGFITKGDLNKEHDIGRVTKDNYIGTYLFPIPYK